MADDSYDFTTDPAFLQASTEDKIGYLSHIDADFAKASYQDQLGYIGHLTGTPVGAHNLAHGLSQPAPMQESALPKWGKAAVEMLPAIGGTAGAVIGAPAAGYGALVGAAAGSGAGEAGRQLLLNKIFGEPLGTVGQQAKGVGTAAAIGGALEAPGALANTLGNRVLAGVERSVPLKQTGDAIQALKENPPAALSARGVQQDLAQTHEALQQQLSSALQKSTGTLKISDLINAARNEAANAPIRNGVAKFDKIIEAAKYNAGITGDAATAQQLAALQKELQKPAYLGNPGPAAKVLQGLLQKAYGGMGQGVRQLAPEAAGPLSKLTDLYAAQGGLKAYGPGNFQAALMSAALHPRTTALVSPLVTAGAMAGFENPRGMIKKEAAEILP